MFAVHRIRGPLRATILCKTKRLCSGEAKDPGRREKWFVQGFTFFGGFCAASAFANCFHVPEMTLTEKAGLTAATAGWSLVGMIIGELFGQAVITLSPVAPRALVIAAVALIGQTVTFEVETKPTSDPHPEPEEQEQK